MEGKKEKMRMMKAPETLSCSVIATRKLCITETSFVSKRNLNYLLLSA
jgi:hypothetical protein